MGTLQRAGYSLPNWVVFCMALYKARTSAHPVIELSCLCRFFPQVHKRWLRFLPFWSQASAGGSILPVPGPQGCSPPSAAPAVPYRTRLPRTHVRGRLQLCPLQQLRPIIPPHAQIHQWSSSTLKQDVLRTSAGGRMGPKQPQAIREFDVSRGPLMAASALLHTLCVKNQTFGYGWKTRREQMGSG